MTRYRPPTTHSRHERAAARRYWRCDDPAGPEANCRPYEVTAGRRSPGRTFETFGAYRLWIADQLEELAGLPVDPDRLEIVAAADPIDPLAVVAWLHNHPLTKIGARP